MYTEDFKIRDFVKENAKEWEDYFILKTVLKNMNNKICYEKYINQTDMGTLSEYIALALIEFWGGQVESASVNVKGIKAFIDSETKK